MKTNRSKHIDFIIADMLSIVLASWLAYELRMSGGIRFLSNAIYVELLFFVLLGYLVLILLKPYHSGILRRGILKELRSVIEINSLLLAIETVFLFTVKQSSHYSRIIIVLGYGLSIVIMYLARLGLKAFLNHKLSKADNQDTTVLVTYRRYLPHLMEAMNSMEKGYYHIIAALLLDEDKDPGDSSAEVDIIYKDNMLEFFRQNAVDDVFIRAKKKEVGELANEFLSMGVTIHFNINSVVDDLPNPRFTNVGEHSFVSAKIDRITIGQRIIKRAIDILAGIVGIIITGILFLILGPIIKIQAPGPVFFSQTRVGRNGRRFKIYKFRSMYTDAEERKKELMAKNQMQGFMFKMENDPRIFPAGNFIRKTSLDEFPQFINIFFGDMSLVGTRPPTEDEYDQYNMHHLSRLAMKPGLTGMWQVSGRSNITDFEEVVRLDNEYIRNFSLTLDIKIILKTFAVVFKHSGAK